MRAGTRPAPLDREGGGTTLFGEGVKGVFMGAGWGAAPFAAQLPPRVVFARVGAHPRRRLCPSDLLSFEGSERGRHLSTGRPPDTTFAHQCFGTQGGRQRPPMRCWEPRLHQPAGALQRTSPHISPLQIVSMARHASSLPRVVLLQRAPGVGSCAEAALRLLRLLRRAPRLLVWMPAQARAPVRSAGGGAVRPGRRAQRGQVLPPCSFSIGRLQSGSSTRARLRLRRSGGLCAALRRIVRRLPPRADDVLRGPAPALAAEQHHIGIGGAR